MSAKPHQPAMKLSGGALGAVGRQEKKDEANERKREMVVHSI